MFAAVVTALYQRERTGKGTYVSSSLLANGLWANSYMATAALCGATFIPRPPREASLNALGAYYQCADGKWLILTILNEDRHWPSLATCLGRPDLIDADAEQVDGFRHMVETLGDLALDAANRVSA